MKKIAVLLAVVALSSFTTPENNSTPSTTNTTVKKMVGSSFTLINDTRDKVSIYTGSGFVSLNKGSKTSISCKTGKEVRWAKSGRKLDVIFKIESKHCGKTLKLSSFL